MTTELRNRLIKELQDVGINNPSEEIIIGFSESMTGKFIAIDIEWDKIKLELKKQNNRLLNLFFK